ncbi:MAG: hypothetical protein ACMG57_05055 [Candidatus Dojkabacteria bacterium]
MNLSDIDLTYLNNIQPSEYANFILSGLVTKLIEILPEEEITAKNYPENYEQIVQLLLQILETIKEYEEEISEDFLKKVFELKNIANLREFKKDLHFTLGMAITNALDTKAGEFNADLINTYTKEELGKMYRGIMRKRDNSIRNAPTDFVANVNTFSNPAIAKLEMIDRRVKVLDATSSLMERLVPHLEGLIDVGQTNRLANAVFAVRTMLSILSEDLSDELRTRLTNILGNLKNLENCDEATITLENALKGIYETPLPDDFYKKKADEA